MIRQGVQREKVPLRDLGSPALHTILLGTSHRPSFGTGTSFVAPFVLLVSVGVFFIRFKPVCDLRFSSWFEFLCVDLENNPQLGRCAVLPGTGNPLSRGCRFTCDIGSRKSFCAKTSRRFSGSFRSICRSLSGISVAFALQHSAGRWDVAAKRILIDCKL
jgi:hypothetical protein